MTLPDWYRRDLMRALIEDLGGEAQDEIKAHETYMSKVSELEKLGLYEEASKVRSIAEDEARHNVTLMQVIGRLDHYVSVEEAAGLLLFPQTPSDWMNLAERIKAQYPYDYVMRASVDYQLETVLGEREGDVDDAKRWLVNKAGELGIS